MDKILFSQFFQLAMLCMFLSMVNYQVDGNNHYLDCHSNSYEFQFVPHLLLKCQFILIAGTVYGGLANPKLTFSQNVKLTAGINKISLLSVAVGLPVSSLAFLLCLCPL